MNRLEKLIAASGLLVAIGGSAMSAYAATIFPAFASTVFWCGCVILVGGMLLLLFAALHQVKRNNKMGDSIEKPVVGIDIKGESQGGPAVKIISNGTSEHPSVGGESIVNAGDGQSAIGLRVVQTGPGIGMHVVQNGPGVGFRSVVNVGGKPTETK